jgi:ABC-type uncharacterized transport system permease subunit
MRILNVWNKIVVELLNELDMNGFKILGVNDGEELHSVTGIDEVLELMGNLDESYLIFHDRHGIRQWIMIIPSNESDCISDYTYTLVLDEIIDRVLEKVV